MKLLPPSLQAFLAIATTGTVHGAARELHLTQTAVTRRLAALESDLGASLFLRSRRGMALTEAGESLLLYCQQARQLEGETLARLATGGPQGTIVLQGPSSVLRARIIPAVGAVLRTHPGIAVEYRLDDAGDGVAALKRGAVDVAIVPRQAVVSELDSKRLRPERYILVGPPAWEGRPLTDVVGKERIVDFDPADQMTHAFLVAHGLRDQCRPDRHFANNTDALASMVEGACGYSVLAEDFAAPLIAAGRLVRFGGRRHYDFEIAAAWYPRRHMARFLRDVIGGLK
jgi:DNA-binding transcriptional LysR family regulator